MTDKTNNNGIAGSNGLLEDNPFAKVFFELSRDKRTGILDIYSEAPPAGRILKRIYIKGGGQFNVQGGSVQETLGSILISREKLSKEDYDRLLKDAGGDHGKLEMNLISQSQSLGIAPHELGEILEFQTAIKITTCFGWVKGYYSFRDVPAEEINKDRVMYSLVPEKILLQGVREQYPSQRIKLEFKDIEKKIFRSNEGLKEVIPLLGLPPGTARFFEHLPQEVRFQSVLKQSKLKPEDAQALFIMLYFTGNLYLQEGMEDFPLGGAYKGAEPKVKPEPKAEKPRETIKEEKKEEKKEAPEQKEKKLPIEERLEREMSDEELLKDIDRFLEEYSKRDMTYFEIMGVDESVPPEKIKKIYFKMAKVFHPDSHPGLFKGEAREKVETLFTKVSEAYDVLSDPQKRQAYVKKLKSKVSDEEMEKANRAITAEMEFQKAEIMLKRGSFAKAREMLEQVIKMMPDEPEYKIYHSWAMYKTDGPGKAQAALKTIQQALKDRPKNKDGYFYLGMINRAEGAADEAIKNFQKVLEMDKYNMEAQRELRVLTMRKEKGGEKGGRFGKKR